MKLTGLHLVSVLFAAFVALYAAGGLYLYSTLRTVERELPVEEIARRPEQSAMITSLSRISTALEALMVEPMTGNLDEFTLALDIAYATIKAYKTAPPAETSDYLQALYDEIGWLLSSLDDLAANMPSFNVVQAQLFDVRLDYIISQLRNIDSETTREALGSLQRQVRQIERLRKGAIILLALITLSLVILSLLLIWQRRTIALLTTARSAVLNREAILKAVSYSAEQFLMKTDWEKSIEDVLIRLGKAAEVSRIYIFQNHIGLDEAVLTSQRFEWVMPGNTPQIDNMELQDLHLRDAGFDRWVDTMSHGEGIYGHVDEFPEAEQETLTKQDIKSIAVVPIFVGEEWWGFMGLDACNTRREWSTGEIEALKAAANTLGAAILRQRAEEKITQSNQRLEEAKQKAEEATHVKSRFLANMSHELRTPLNSIIGFTRLVAKKTKDILPSKQYENLHKVLISSEHLLTLINDVLDLTKLENDLMTIQPVDFMLEPLIDECLQTFEPVIKRKNLHVVKEFEKDQTLLHIDKVRMKQILMNLLDNAVKFTEEGVITVTVSQSNSDITIAINDTGVGIPEEKLDLLFKDFRQVDDSSTRRHKGTGLGLSISRRLARLMEGDITVVSNEGVGSTFYITIPMRIMDIQTGKPITETSSS